MSFIDGFEAFRVMEESERGVLDLFLVDAPRFAEVVKNAGLLVEDLDGALLADVLKPDDTVADA